MTHSTIPDTCSQKQVKYEHTCLQGAKVETNNVFHCGEKFFLHFLHLNKNFVLCVHTQYINTVVLKTHPLHDHEFGVVTEYYSGYKITFLCMVARLVMRTSTLKEAKYEALLVSVPPG